MQQVSVSVPLPAPTADAWGDFRWEVPLTDRMSGQVLGGTVQVYGGAISMTGVGTILATAADARQLAGALLAAAEELAGHQ